MTVLFSIDELIGATGGHGENINAEFISSISIDSRTIKTGALYVAIKGDRFDGHGFVHKAVVNGAAVALVSKEKARELAGLPLIIVPDPLAGLEEIAKVARDRSKAKIIAITGSAGKTTTKNMVAEILSRVGETHASIKSYNNHWGVPLMLASMPASAEFGVFEIGMNHGGEIAPLVELVRPHVALVTNVGSAHVGNFDGFEGIAAAKAEILGGIEPSGTAIVNADQSYIEVFSKSLKGRLDIEFSTFGFSSSADVGI
ncbi:MAG TPA: UDP-N-acetylmuramoylalanyl-D-glutamyl-2, 6-diaminopimelate--D-alanyl-D-alanine ligase, partial [Myxococcales bacterium]|nr:UDP-N-acetylmuramoylalanyl-D-glutamyl-2, 6-diaminopimelate--D-alanyl-D-alanine ligase [Myxococcales bacterium]